MKTIEVKGLDKVSKMLDVLAKDDYSRELKTIGEMVKGRIDESFETERSAIDGKPWRRLYARTTIGEARRKSRMYKTLEFKRLLSDKRILRDSGDLADRWIVRADKYSVVVSNNIQHGGFHYGLTHQYGSSKLNIPARPFMPIEGNKLISDLEREVLEYLERKVRERFK